MATVPIVTEVTKAELDALVAADGLNEGLQYKVTDKDWLLVATGVDTLKASTGTLKIVNGTDLTGITSDILVVYSGIINYNIDTVVNGGVPLQIINPSEAYNPMYVEILAFDDAVANITIDYSPVIPGLDAGSRQCISLNSITQSVGTYIQITAEGIGESLRIGFCVTFYRANMFMPV